MLRVLRAISVLALLTAPVFAQFENAEVLGTVRDSSGAAIAKATVTLLNIETSIQAKTITDESGNFLFPNVRVGNFKVTAEAAGFSKAVADNIKVDVGARQRVDLTLQ